ncbi:YczE/YyaS/YitT family protein [Desulfofalx alkaliphila]|uniref:YczE/YyaS/YitT family protein n=1 Tax=Desulfofalx alkaliphila TaxID=105483 RepID=UPI00068C7264|nr:YitT family protein [Desulfofalx alkaliphila]
MKKPLFYVLQYAWFVLGLLVLSLGIVLLVQAWLGPTPWDVLHLGLTNYLPFTFGQVMIGLGVLLVLISWLLGEKPYTGTLLNMVLIGIFVDIIMQGHLLPVPQHLAFRILYMVAGTLACGFATGVYISAKLGAGPRDSLMLALHRITGLRIGAVRTAMEVTVVVVGFLLGGHFGVGTIFFSVTIGWVTEFFLSLFRKIAQSERFSVFKERYLIKEVYGIERG